MFVIYLKSPPHLSSFPLPFIIHSSSSVPGDVILIQLFIALADKWGLSGWAGIEKDIVSLAQVSPVSTQLGHPPQKKKIKNKLKKLMNVLF